MTALPPGLRELVDHAVDRMVEDEQAQRGLINAWLEARGLVAVDSTAKPMYLESEECIVLLQALVKAVAPRHVPPDDATECSRIVWESRATSVQRSLATALAEATY